MAKQLTSFGGISLLQFVQIRTRKKYWLPKRAIEDTALEKFAPMPHTPRPNAKLLIVSNNPEPLSGLKSDRLLLASDITAFTVPTSRQVGFRIYLHHTYPERPTGQEVNFRLVAALEGLPSIQATRVRKGEGRSKPLPAGMACSSEWLTGSHQAAEILPFSPDHWKYLIYDDFDVNKRRANHTVSYMADVNLMFQEAGTTNAVVSVRVGLLPVQGGVPEPWYKLFDLSPAQRASAQVHNKASLTGNYVPEWVWDQLRGQYRHPRGSFRNADKIIDATYEVPPQSSDTIGFTSLLISPEDEWLKGRDDVVQAPLFRITNGGNYGVRYTYNVRIKKHPQDERTHIAVFVSQGRGERPDPNTDWRWLQTLAAAEHGKRWGFSGCFKVLDQSGTQAGQGPVVLGLGIPATLRSEAYVLCVKHYPPGKNQMKIQIEHTPAGGATLPGRLIYYPFKPRSG